MARTSCLGTESHQSGSTSSICNSARASGLRSRIACRTAPPSSARRAFSWDATASAQTGFVGSRSLRLRTTASRLEIGACSRESRRSLASGPRNCSISVKADSNEARVSKSSVGGISMPSRIKNPCACGHVALSSRLSRTAIPSSSGSCSAIASSRRPSNRRTSTSRSPVLIPSIASRNSGMRSRSMSMPISSLRAIAASTESASSL